MFIGSLAVKNSARERREIRLGLHAVSMQNYTELTGSLTKPARFLQLSHLLSTPILPTRSFALKIQI
jgi:hypothetical protein